MKKCRCCGEDKPVTEFNIHHADVRRTECKTCEHARLKAWRDADPEAHKARKKAEYEAHKPRVRDYMLRYKYGIGLEGYAALLKKQEGKCQICGRTEPRGNGSFHVDHDHNTGRIRGLLCNDCNTGLGKFRDDARLLLAAARYLEAV